jgi:trimethylamine--corrinoid protein Co-methyltransferase
LWGFSRETQKISFSVLSKDDLKAIHWATLNVLERTGFRVYSEKCLKMLDEAGCRANYKNRSALIPSHLVEEALRKKREAITLCARNPKYNVKLDGRHVYISTDGNGTNTIDLETGRRRPSIKDDIAKSAVIADALDTVNVYWPLVTSQDTPPHVRHLHDLEASLTNTEKHVQFETTMSPEEARYQIDMAAAVVGGEKELKKRPIVSSVHCTIAPLQHDGGSVEAALEFAKAGVPISFYSMPQAGATGPVTLAGSLTVANAEVLSGLVMAQLASPGAPVIYGTGGAAFDMKACCRTGGSPEQGLFSAAVGELARYYSMPSVTGGFVSTAKEPGGQACYEKMISGIPQVLSGCSIIIGVGLIEDCNTLPFEELIIDDEIVKMVFRLAQGIEVKDDALALDLIHKVGPGGNYLAERHTLEHFRKEQFIPDLTDRRSYETWLRDGAKDVVKKAKEKVKTILEKYQPEPLEKDVQREIQDVIKRADKGLANI